jgi:ABC-2 type transport system ATP-binding protein
MIDVEHLVKDYGTVVAVKDVSFHVGRGEIVGFLGPNGAGKSTTLRILSGFLGPTSGEVRIDGHDALDESVKTRRSIGYMPEAAPLYPEMRVREYLRFRAELKGVARQKRTEALGYAMEASRVSDMADTLIAHLSKGYRQRVGLADALVAKPPLLILDEPTAGLDPNQIREVRKLIRELGDNHTILLSTHILPEVETTCQRAVVIDRGLVVAEGSIDELRARRGTQGAKLLVVDPDGRAATALEVVDGVAKVRLVESKDGLARLLIAYDEKAPRDGSMLERVVARLVGDGFGVREAVPERATLEDVFRELTVSEADVEESGATS